MKFGFRSRIRRVCRELAASFITKAAPHLGIGVVYPDGQTTNLAGYDLVPKGQYDYVPRGSYVSGPADRFLLVPKNRYRLTLLPGQTATNELGVGWVTEENTPAGYDRLWGSAETVAAYKEEAAGVRERMPREIVDHVRDAVLKAESICDIGCGVGDLLSTAAELNPGVRLAGLDFSEAAVTRANQRLPGADLKQHVIVDSLPFASDSFDVVFCTDVIEHLEYRDKVVADLVRICAPGGRVVIVVPDGDVDQFFGHLWFFSEKSLAEFLGPWKADVARLPDCREFMACIVKPSASSL